MPLTPASRRRLLPALGALLLGCLLPAAAHAQTPLDDVLDPARLPFLKQSRLVQLSSYDRTGANDDRLVLRPGETATIMDVEGPGVITRIWMTVSSPDPYFLRRLVLRMYWDDEVHPSVEAPLGDFFGTGFGYAPYASAFVGMTSGGYFSYFPMPFGRRARVEVVNETGQEVPAFYYHIDYQQLRAPLGDDVAYFHAQWKRDVRTPRGTDYTVLEAEGRGHFVGVNMSMQGLDGNYWFLEGDEKIYVDGETTPSVYGTGTEDYFTSGWYFNRGTFATPYHGLIVKDDSLARIAAYRFHVGDVIPFEEGLRFDLEHGHASDQVGDYSSTAYWYQKEPHRPFPELLPAGRRIPLRVVVPGRATEAEALRGALDGLPADVEDMGAHGADWSGRHQLRVTARRAGDRFTMHLPAGAERGLQVDLYYTKGPAYGPVRVLHEGREVARFDGRHDRVVPGGRVSLPALPAADGAVALTFETTGAHDVGLDAFVLEPDRAFIEDWNLVGPFPNPSDGDGARLGLDAVYGPERGVDLDDTYEGVDGRRVGWERARVDAQGQLVLWNRFEPADQIVSYAHTWIYAPEAQTVPLLLGSDDGVKVFLDGRELHRFLAIRIPAPDQDRVMLPLREGWNSLLVKVENNYGGYSLFARLLGAGEGVRVSPERDRP